VEDGESNVRAVEAQRRAAQKAGAAFYDLFKAMGGPGSADQWPCYLSLSHKRTESI